MDTIAPKHSNDFYAIRNAADKTARNDQMRRASRNGMPVLALASAAQVAPSTARSVIRTAR